MRQGKEESSSGCDQNIDLISAVGELNGVPSRELNKLLKDSENFTMHWKTEAGSSKQIDMEKLASSLPLHLIAVLLSPDRDQRMAHVLRGIRLLHTMSDLATRHARLEQILLDDVKFSEQIMDLVFFGLIVLSRRKQDNHLGSSPLLHSVLVACSLHLLTAYLSSQWHDLVHVLLAHPKVDIFMDVAFDAVREDIRILHIKLSELNREVLCSTSSLPASARTVQYICQQCEASLQFLLSLCQQKLFRDRVLRNKELCKNGGILLLACAILKLNVPNCFKESYDIAAIVSRLKAKVLSILLQLCEAESISYLDEVAGSPKSMNLAKSVALEFLDLLKTAFRREAKQQGGSHDKSNPMGPVLLNALRLADVFSDDSNFRSFFMTNTIPVLAEILSIPLEDFLSRWCSVNIPVIEEDANVDYDPFTACGAALVSVTDGCESSHSASVLLAEANSACAVNFSGMPSVTYAQQRTSCLVKIIANLHVFVPAICEDEERNLFLNKFHKYVLMESVESSKYPSNFDTQQAATICKNLDSLSKYGASLIPNLLNDEDVHLLSVFSDQLQKISHQQIEDTLLQESQHTGGDAPSLMRKQSGSAQVETSNFYSNNVKAKGEISERSLCPELDKLKVTGTSATGLPDDFELDQDKKNIISAIGTASESSRGIEKVTDNFEGKDLELSSSKMDLDLISNTGVLFKSAEYTKESGFQEDEKAENVQGEEKIPRKRKRNIMNEIQIMLIEKALLDEPEMQRNAAMLQLWADKLSSQGSEITSSQLKNWLNNRKARLARAAREGRTPSEGETTFPDRSSGPIVSQFYDSPDSAGEDFYAPATKGSTHQSTPKSTSMLMRATSGEGIETTPPTDFVHGIRLNHPSMKSASFEVGQFVLLRDAEGKEIGKGKVYQVKGRWQGKSLEDSDTCIVDITELKTDKWKEVQHPSEAAGRTFEEAAAKNGGVIRVAWDINRISSVAK